MIKLHTVAGTILGEAPGNSFVINKAGSGTTVTGIRIENTETWLFNTSNVTFTGVTMGVEEARVGSGGFRANSRSLALRAHADFARDWHQ